MRRALLIMNPEARGVTPAIARVVEAALEARFKLEKVKTEARQAATQATREAVENGAELVVAFGGDGLVNEVVNGIAGLEATLAIVPGGTMNVLARNLGIPKDPVEATDRILRSADSPPRQIRLGAANGHYFTFACGCGFDAEAAAWVEAHRASKQRFGEPYFYAAGFLTFLKSYSGRRPFLLCEGEFGRVEAVMAAALNTATYAYLAGRPVRLGSASAVDPRLDLFILRRMKLVHLPAYVTGALFTGRYGPESATLTGVNSYTVSSEEPFAFHLDGEPMTPTERVEVVVAREVLRILL
ncbi:MAG: diacylglycerol/lipid kinase family protein [Actinomycetota bacterium]